MAIGALSLHEIRSLIDRGINSDNNDVHNNDVNNNNGEDRA